MANNSNHAIFLVILVVLGLSFKDLLLIKVEQKDKSTTKTADGGLAVNLKFDDTESDNKESLSFDAKENKSDDFEDDSESEDSEPNGFTESPATSDDNVKEIPSLKMKSNVQTMKFLYW